MIKFTVPIPPSVNKAYGMKVEYRGGRAFPQRYLTSESRNYKKYVMLLIKRIMKENNIEYLIKDKTSFVNLKMTVYIDKKRKDVDNMFKLLFDSIVDSGLIPDDDIIIYNIEDIFIDKLKPRLEIEMSISDKIGIFKNEKMMNKFKLENCSLCKKSNYKRQCSIFKKALENRIEPDINLKNNICYKKNP
ncbi:RusA family crossover junction endodeoxyribonuclease [Terrisporobacter sp.]|uniref:RusA family crossover junction endodeoxyribonuclease n=1 Tax=Terrisporobacter sp. TaxID=1965305 RepID=UPI0039943269